MTNTNMGDLLPTLPFWQARSFWATALTASLTIANALGVDVLGRLGTDEASIMHTVDAVLPVATAMWAWMERRAPNYKLGV